jgi:RNA polymerase primary sigma factor
MGADAHANVLADARRGDRLARERLIADYLPVVRAIASRYRDLGVPLDDLVQEGSLGLLEAVSRFDVRRSDDFGSYARFRIRRAIRNSLTEQSRLIRLPKQVVERRRAIDAAEARFRATTGRMPTTVELVEETGLSLAAIRAARSVGTPPVSLDEPVLEDGSPLESLVVDGASPDPLDESAEHERTRAVDEAVRRLPPRQREIVARHFGFGCDAEQIADVAASLHVSQQRARAIERDALYRLRDGLEPVVGSPPPR